MSEWYYAKGGQQYGPINEALFKGRIVTGEVASGDLVWKEGMEKWLPLSEVGEFAEVKSSDIHPDVPHPLLSAGAVSAAMPMAPPTSALAIASMVCGILTILLSCSLVFGIIFAIPAVVCGHLSMKQFSDPRDPKGGREMSIAGLICGYLGGVFSLFMISLIGIAIVSDDTFMEGVRKEIEKSSQSQESDEGEIESSGDENAQ